MFYTEEVILCVFLVLHSSGTQRLVRVVYFKHGELPISRIRSLEGILESLRNVVQYNLSRSLESSRTSFTVRVVWRHFGRFRTV